MPPLEEYLSEAITPRIERVLANRKPVVLGRYTETINTAIGEALRLRDVTEQFVKMGVQPVGGSVAEMKGSSPTSARAGAMSSARRTSKIE